MNINIYTKLFLILFILTSYFISANDFTKTTIGYSVNKRSIELYKFGSGNDIIIIIAGIHGNESNTTKTALSLIKSLTQNKIKIPDDKAVWIIPKANPDGLIRDRRLNDNNVDLNRNFETDDWQPNFYFFNILLSAGKYPFSEPETIALKLFFKSICKKNINPVVLSLHSRGNVIIPGNDSSGNNKLCSYIKMHSTYKPGDIGYTTTGDLTGWLSDKLSIASVTIEFKTKTDEEINEIENIISSLLKIDFEKNFYKYGILVKTFEKITNEKIESFLYGLPKKIIEKIISSNNKKEHFMKLYESIKNDNELLLLVNKNNFLPKDYKPDDLVEVKFEYSSTKKSFMLRKIILQDLKEMLNNAKSENINLKIISAYRSYETQEKVHSYWKKILGEEEAKKVSAIPGASQHQLGTAIDFNSLKFSFGETKEGIWLAKNGYKFGFIMSYPLGEEELTGYKYEPWHYRYIGKNAALLVHDYFNNLLELFLNWYWEKKIEK